MKTRSQRIKSNRTQSAVLVLVLEGRINEHVCVQGDIYGKVASYMSGIE